MDTAHDLDEAPTKSWSANGGSVRVGTLAADGGHPARHGRGSGCVARRGRRRSEGLRRPGQPDPADGAQPSRGAGRGAQRLPAHRAAGGPARRPALDRAGGAAGALLAGRGDGAAQLRALSAHARARREVGAHGGRRRRDPELGDLPAGRRGGRPGRRRRAGGDVQHPARAVRPRLEADRGALRPPRAGASCSPSACASARRCASTPRSIRCASLPPGCSAR